jgi:penicillin-binding protein 2
MNLYGGLVESCDSYFFKVAEILNVDELADACRDFGLGVKTGIDLPNEAEGLVPDREYYNRRYGKGKWTQGLVLNNIIGQGEYLATVLQMCRLAAAVANGGFLVQPHVIKEIEGEGNSVYQKKKIRHLAPRMIDYIQGAMLGVVQDQNGTARSSKIPDMKTAGKTGTAQNPHGEDHAWFIGYAPADEPEISIAIIVENAGHGGAVAAPISRDFYLDYFQIGLADSIVTQQGRGTDAGVDGGRQ